MKKIMLLVIVALGVMLTTTSCGAQAYYGYQPACPAYVTGIYGTYQTTPPSPTGLFVKSNNLKESGTYVVGNSYSPSKLQWVNMSIVKNGCLVFVYDSANQLIAQYDLRTPKQDVCDIFQPTGYTGKALSVTVCIYGGRGYNAVIVRDGNAQEEYHL